MKRITDLNKLSKRQVAKRGRPKATSKTNMADSGNEILINGKPLSALRLVELKEELLRRGLPRSGNKTQLIEKLKKEIDIRVSQQESNANKYMDLKKYAIVNSSSNVTIQVEPFNNEISNGNGTSNGQKNGNTDSNGKHDTDGEDDENVLRINEEDSEKSEHESDEEIESNQDTVIGLPEQTIDFEGEAEPNQPEVLEIASEFIGQQSSSLDVNVDLNGQKHSNEFEQNHELNKSNFNQQQINEQASEEESNEDNDDEDDEEENEIDEQKNDDDGGEILDDEANSDEIKINISSADNEATSTTLDNPEDDATQESEPEKPIESSSTSRKRKWTSPVSLRSGFFKGISLESLNILNLRKSSTTQTNSEPNSMVPSENNSEANSTQASDDEDGERAPAKKIKIDTNDESNAVQLNKPSIASNQVHSHDINNLDQMQGYNPFSLPRLRGFFSRILNRVF